eukprot:g27008.t1
MSNSCKVFVFRGGGHHPPRRQLCEFKPAPKTGPGAGKWHFIAIDMKKLNRSVQRLFLHTNTERLFRHRNTEGKDASLMHGVVEPEAGNWLSPWLLLPAVWWCLSAYAARKYRHPSFPSVLSKHLVEQSDWLGCWLEWFGFLFKLVLFKEYEMGGEPCRSIT